METSLHRQLKARYADSGGVEEVTFGGYRIDVVRGGELIEIQHGPLAALRRKVASLLESHRVRVVKPIVARKLLVRCQKKSGPVLSRRKSPKRGQLLDLFHDLVYFRGVYPHPRLTLEAVLVDVEEWRYPGHGRRRRRRARDHQVEDQRLLSVGPSAEFRTAGDLRRLIDAELPQPFHTGHLAAGLQIERWVAQRIAYCLRHAGAVREVGKLGNARLYRFRRSPARRETATQSR